MNLPNQIAEPPELATSHYWESRATTAEAKIKDWSVRAVECEQRVRELETKAEDWELRAIGSGQKAELAEERIAKAKAILSDCYLPSDKYAQRVLAALEGK